MTALLPLALIAAALVAAAVALARSVQGDDSAGAEEGAWPAWRSPYSDEE